MKSQKEVNEANNRLKELLDEMITKSDVEKIKVDTNITQRLDNQVSYDKDYVVFVGYCFSLVAFPIFCSFRGFP